jgi:hypothetical protein
MEIGDISIPNGPFSEIQERFGRGVESITSITRNLFMRKLPKRENR